MAGDFVGVATAGIRPEITVLRANRRTRSDVEVQTGRALKSEVFTALARIDGHAANRIDVEFSDGHTGASADIGIEAGIRERMEHDVREREERRVVTVDRNGHATRRPGIEIRSEVADFAFERELRAEVVTNRAADRPAGVEFDLDRWASYEVAREAMRDRIATLSAEVARIENEIVDVGVEMGQLDSTDMDAIQTAIAKYRPGLAREEAIAELLATARRLAPAFEDFVNPSKSDLEVLEAATAMARAMTNWGPFVDNPMHPALDVPDVDLSRREGLADRIVADIDGWTRMLPGAKIPLSIRVEGLPDHVAERLEVLKGLENKGLPVKIELIDGSDQD